MKKAYQCPDIRVLAYEAEERISVVDEDVISRDWDASIDDLPLE